MGPRAYVRRITDQWFAGDWTYDGDTDDFADVTPDRRVNYIVADVSPLPDPHEAFIRLTWGGQMLLLCSDAEQAMQAVRVYASHDGFVVEVGPQSVRTGFVGMRLPGLGPKRYFAVVRKVTLLEPGEDTDRFTFDVRLVRKPELGNRYVVMKQVPRYRRVVSRLHNRFPEASQQVLLERAEKLVKRVFPVFLTREAGFLQLIHRDLPPEYAGRVPEALGFEKASDGTIKRLYMTWVRLGGPSLSHMEFSKQAAELLSVLHDTVGVIHLDLRLDNVLISQGKVCFLDFGSSVRVGEEIHRSPLLSSLFDEMLNSSQIQRTMGKMVDTGRLTSDVIVAAHGKIDKAVDMFYLSLQITKPLANPDLLPYIRYEPGSEVARRIKLLTAAILRPSNPNRPHFISAKDVYIGLTKLERKINDQSSKPS